jgi:hypothetical protein
LTEPSSYADQDYPDDVINALEIEEEERQALEKLQLSMSMNANKVTSPPFLGRSGTRKNASMLKASRDLSISSDTLSQLREQQKSLARFRSSELLKPNLATWYSNTIFAKESVLERIPHKRVPLGASAIARATKDRLHGAGNPSGALRLYQHLEPYELEAVRLPALKPRGAIVSPPTPYRD